MLESFKFETRTKPRDISREDMQKQMISDLLLAVTSAIKSGKCVLILEREEAILFKHASKKDRKILSNSVSWFRVTAWCDHPHETLILYERDPETSFRYTHSTPVPSMSICCLILNEAAMFNDHPFYKVVPIHDGHHKEIIISSLNYIKKPNLGQVLILCPDGSPFPSTLKKIGFDFRDIFALPFEE